MPHFTAIDDNPKEVTKPEDIKLNASRILITDLPSKFKLYPKNCEIYYDTYSYGDIKFLSDSNLPRHVRNKIILQGIHTSFSKEDLTYMDFIHIAFLRKLSSLNTPEFTFEYTCTCTSKILKKNFGIGDLEFEDLKATFPVTVNFFSVDSIAFNPILVGELNRLLEDNLLQLKIPYSELEIDDDIALLAACTDDYDKNYEIIKNITNKDDLDLLELLEPILEHGLEPFKFKCNNRVLVDNEYETCGKNHVQELTGGELLIYPFRESDVALEDRLSFGK